MRTLTLLAFLGCAALAQAQQPKTYAPETAPRSNEETVLNARVVSVDTAGARLTVRGVDVKADGGRDETFSVAAPAASRLGELKRGTEVLLRLRGTTVIEVKPSMASAGPGNTNAAAPTRGQTRTGSRAPSSTGAAAPATVTVAPTAGVAVPAGGTAVVIPEGVVPVAPDANVAPATAAAPNAGPTPSMVGIAPGSGNARTNAQGAITLTGSPAASSPAPRASSPRPRPASTARPRPAVTPQPTVTPAPQAGLVSPEPATGSAVVVPGTVGVGGVVAVGTPSPAAYGTPFPTPRPQPTPVPVGTPPPVPTPVPVLVPSDAPPSPATTPTPSPQT